MSLEDRKKALLPLLTDPEEAVRASASRALDSIQGLEHLSNLAKSALAGDKERRIRAIHLLGETGADGAFQTLLGLLGDPEPDIRVSVIRSLRKKLPERALIPLAGCLDDPDPSVVGNALLTLSGYRDGRVTDLLVPSLENPNREIASAAADALGRNGDPAAEPFLIRLLERTTDPYLRSKAAEALGNLRPPG